MARGTHYRPRVGRETRLLITTALFAALALWMLARLRFVAPAADPRTMAELLAAIGAPSDFDGLSGQIGRLQGLLGPSFLTVEVDGAGANDAPRASAALRLGGEFVVTYVPPGERLRSSAGVVLLAHDGATGLAVVRMPDNSAPPLSTPRPARLPAPPQYVLATAVHENTVALRPVYVAALSLVEAPAWAAEAYALPTETDLAPGAFLFARSGEFVGLTIGLRESVAFVSAGTVLDEANRLMANPVTAPLHYGIQVHDLSPPLADALGASNGVVVAWVSPSGPAHGLLSPRDVIESVDGQPLPTLDHWRRHVAALAAETPVTMTVRRSGAIESVTVTPVTGVESGKERDVAARRPFGASTRAIRGVGSEVLAVESGSAAALAGLRTGDIITAIGDVAAPTPAQITRAMARQTTDQSVILGVRRGEEHRLLVMP